MSENGWASVAHKHHLLNHSFTLCGAWYQTIGDRSPALFGIQWISSFKLILISMATYYLTLTHLLCQHSCNALQDNYSAPLYCHVTPVASNHASKWCRKLPVISSSAPRSFTLHSFHPRCTLHSIVFYSYEANIVLKCPQHQQPTVGTSRALVISVLSTRTIFEGLHTLVLALRVNAFRLSLVWV